MAVVGDGDHFDIIAAGDVTPFEAEHQYGFVGFPAIAVEPVGVPVELPVPVDAAEFIGGGAAIIPSQPIVLDIGKGTIVGKFAPGPHVMLVEQATVGIDVAVAPLPKTGMSGHVGHGLREIRLHRSN